MIIVVGSTVEYQGKEYTVLGYAASEDDKGRKLIEIAWNDYAVSPTGYLAVPRDELRVIRINFKNVKLPGAYW
jgi:hypothetical protein